MNSKELFTSSNILCIDGIKIALAERKVINGIKQIGLSHSVIAYQAIDIRAEVHIEIDIGLEIS